ncbi:hypothetical protein AB733_15925 [Photobacterium swingsii]|uniref:Chromosome partitioning protein ParB n=1 Tax=Photobacterium swingsii TaxID=680026 RepID=A0A0J8V9G0_9GAMM|nr:MULTISPECIES: hypothetical protein [Photobacterium]KMV29787.1 hypothetical protein AB733_15925 [Photobacterium swingsii]MDO6501028.1 hypothetical protein [Photobacterium sanguinicancri]PSW22819.1 hypothetical protein C9I94_18750 [Photobacterium swingsii]
MRQQYHFRNSEKGLLAWDVFRLIEFSCELPTIEIQLSDIKELEEEFWYDLGGARPTCKNVLEHASLIQNADLSYPIILCHEGRVMDGMHRVCKAVMLGHITISAVQFPTHLEPDYVGIEADDLPY